MAESSSAEYRALVANNDKMISEISADPLTVTSKLMAKGLIPPVSLSSAHLQAKEKELKASELVEQICKKVNTFPEKFELFVEVLNELMWLQDLANLLAKECNKLKVKKVKLPIAALV